MEKSELTNAQKQNRVRQRIAKASVDPDKYEYIPAKEQNDHVKADEFQRVAVYARVSTDDPMQTTSFELQQKYYEELVAQHPKWVLVKIYTAPLRYEPVEVFLPGLNQNMVDKSTERWLGEIEEKLHYEKWYCGHYHTAKKIDKIEFMFDNFDEFLVNDSDCWENYNWCYECRGNGDDFQLDENGELVSRCDDCSLKPRGDGN